MSWNDTDHSASKGRKKAIMVHLRHLLPWNYIRDLKKKYKTLFPPGHFYSPIPDIVELRQIKDYLYSDDLPDIDLNDARQIAMVDIFMKYYAEIPYLEGGGAGLRYTFENDYFRYSDGVILYSFLRHLAPRRVIEIGAGHSTMLMLDVNQRFFGNRMELVVAEPYPGRLRAIMEENDQNLFKLHEKPMQALDIGLFRALEPGDILFIDSSHIGKSGSDVLHYLFRVLPELQAGVYIHLHDMFYPFEYPFEWLEMGRAWNELYLVRAFLAYNRDYAVEYFNDYMGQRQAPLLQAKLPLCRHDNGSSLWLKKLR